MTNRIALITVLAMLLNTAQAQGQDSAATAASSGTTTETKPAAKKSALSFAPQTRMQYFRPLDQRGINMFEAPKVAGATYDGFALQFGASFAQEFQGLKHE